MVRVHEGDVFLDPTGSDVAFVSFPGATEPGGGGSVDGADVEVVAVGDDPDGPGATKRAVASE